MITNGNGFEYENGCGSTYFTFLKKEERSG